MLSEVNIQSHPVGPTPPDPPSFFEGESAVLDILATLGACKLHSSSKNLFQYERTRSSCLSFSSFKTPDQQLISISQAPETEHAATIPSSSFH